MAGASVEAGTGADAVGEAVTRGEAVAIVVGKAGAIVVGEAGVAGEAVAGACVVGEAGADVVSEAVWSNCCPAAAVEQRYKKQATLANSRIHPRSRNDSKTEIEPQL
jgi:hypothetical protein